MKGDYLEMHTLVMHQSMQIPAPQDLGHSRGLGAFCLPIGESGH